MVRTVPCAERSSQAPITAPRTARTTEDSQPPSLPFLPSTQEAKAAALLSDVA